MGSWDFRIKFEIYRFINGKNINSFFFNVINLDWPSVYFTRGRTAWSIFTSNLPTFLLVSNQTSELPTHSNWKRISQTFRCWAECSLDTFLLYPVMILPTNDSEKCQLYNVEKNISHISKNCKLTKTGLNIYSKG